MDDASSAFSGVAFHCYAGNFTQQDSFHNAFPSKEVYFTECTGEYGSDWWTDIKVRTSYISLPARSVLTSFLSVVHGEHVSLKLQCCSTHFHST